MQASSQPGRAKSVPRKENPPNLIARGATKLKRMNIETAFLVDTRVVFDKLLPFETDL